MQKAEFSLAFPAEVEITSEIFDQGPAIKFAPKFHSKNKKKAHRPIGRPPDLHVPADSGKLMSPELDELLLKDANVDAGVSGMLSLAQEHLQISCAPIAAHWILAKQCPGVDQHLCATVIEAATTICRLHRTGGIGDADLHIVLGSTIKTILDLPTPVA